MSEETKKPTFEHAIERLEQIVASIEQGKVPLEESIKRYGEGIELVKQCRVILDSAEKKIQLLTVNDDASISPAGELDASDSGE